MSSEDNNKEKGQRVTQRQPTKGVHKSRPYLRPPKNNNQKGTEITEKELRTYIFGWLWVEDNIMKEVRERLEK